MFLYRHDVVVPTKKHNSYSGYRNFNDIQIREFLKRGRRGFAAITDDIPRSFIIAEEDKKSRIYLSPISSVTLLKRSGSMNDIYKL